ncbi:hypothetical protein SETIT_1G178700v2 [Setaria italica]|uniref:Uncharacterized protein n=1 Tax=Setaria italica TaxID=4555 RepID=A0A368PLI1_SETIT|nr:hypothetical protein SETIT_1G178700v2 [Setaria italica]
MNPTVADTIQVAEAELKAGQDPIVDVQAMPKASSPAVKPLRLSGEPMLKLRRLSRKCFDMYLGGPSLRPVTDGGSLSVQDVAPGQASMQPEEHPATISSPGAISFVAALMRDVISSLNDVVVPASELQVPEEHQVPEEAPAAVDVATTSVALEQRIAGETTITSGTMAADAAPRARDIGRDSDSS